MSQDSRIYRQLPDLSTKEVVASSSTEKTQMESILDKFFTVFTNTHLSD